MQPAARECDVCERPYIAKRANSRYCSDTCRQRAKRAGGVSQEPPAEHVDGDLALAIRATLEDSDRLSSPLGQQALMLARQAEQEKSSSALAQISRELRATLADALAGAKAADDSVDQVKARRDAKLRKAAG